MNSQLLSGSPRSEHQPRRLRLVFQALISFILLSIFLCVAGLWLSYYVGITGSSPPDNRAFNFMLVAIGLLGFIGLADVRSNWGVHVLLFADGVVQIAPHKSEIFLWDDVETVFLGLSSCPAPQKQLSTNGEIESAWLPMPRPFFMPSLAHVTLKRRDGVTGGFSAALSDHEELLKEIQKQTFKKLWPSIWRSFGLGQEVAFGEIAISKAGVRTPSGFLPWSDVKQFLIKESSVVIDKKWQLLSWYQCKTFKNGAVIPNQHILLTLAGEAMKEQHK